MAADATEQSQPESFQLSGRDGVRSMAAKRLRRKLAISAFRAGRQVSIYSTVTRFGLTGVFFGNTSDNTPSAYLACIAASSMSCATLNTREALP